MQEDKLVKSLIQENAHPVSILQFHIKWFPDGSENGGGWEGVGILPDGRKYVGVWKEGLRDGQGIFTFPDGYRFSGEWKKDLRWTGIVLDVNGEIVGKIFEGVEL